MDNAIGQDDVDLLLAVMDAAAQLVPPSGPGVGIIGDRVSARIGELHGCSPRTIRRRIKRSTDALSQLAQAVVVDENRPYRAADVARTLGLPVLATVACAAPTSSISCATSSHSIGTPRANSPWTSG